MTDTQTEAAVREQILDLIGRLDLTELARLGAHESDDEAVVPRAGTDGAAFLEDARDAYIAWVRREGRFPDDPEDAVGGWALTRAMPSQQAQAFVDLGLYYSHHSDFCSGAKVYQLRAALDSMAEQIAASL